MEILRKQVKKLKFAKRFAGLFLIAPLHFKVVYVKIKIGSEKKCSLFCLGVFMVDGQTQLVIHSSVFRELTN